MMIAQKATCLGFMIFLWFSISMVLVRCEVLGKPKFMGKVETKYRAEIGKAVKLRCPVTGTEDPEHNKTLVAWKYRGTFIVSSLQKWSRFHIKPGKWLKIVFVNDSDAGVYKCSAHNPNGKIEIKITLVIRRPGKGNKGRPPKFKKNARREMSFKTGETAQLKCHSTGSPDPHIQWFKDGQSYGQHKRTSVSPSGWTLNLRYLNVDDSGRYSCRVTNTFGSINRTFTVKVKARIFTPIIHEPDTDNVTVVHGTNATLVCRAWSLGKPVFKWKRWTRTLKRFNTPRDLRVTQLMNKEQVYKSRSTVMDRNEFKAVLVIKNATKKDAGKYRCIVQNKHGVDKMDIYLHVFDEVHKPTIARTTVAASESGVRNRGVESTPIILVVGLTAAIVITLIFIIVLIVCCRKQRKNLEKQYVIEYKPEELFQHQQSTCGSQEMQRVLQQDATCENCRSEKSWKQQSCGNAVRTLKDVKEHLDSCFTSTRQTQCSQCCLRNNADSEQTIELRNSSADGGLNLNSRTSSQRTLSRHKSSSRELSSTDCNRSADCPISRGPESKSTESSLPDNATNEKVSCDRDLRESVV